VLIVFVGLVCLCSVFVFYVLFTSENRHPSFGGYVNLVMFIAQLQLAGGKYDGMSLCLIDLLYSRQCSISANFRENIFTNGYTTDSQIV